MDFLEDYNVMKAELGPDGVSKLNAIMLILEIGNTNIAQAKHLLKCCDRCLEIGVKTSLNYSRNEDS